MKLLTEDSLGFNKEQVVMIKNVYYMENLESYKDELRKLPEVIQVSASAWVPGDKITNWGFGAEGMEKSFSLNANLTDESYVETMGMEMALGRYFSRDFKADTGKIVLNETAVSLLEMEDPIGKITYLWNDRTLPYEVIGVVKDYHWESKHMKVRPHALMLLNDRFRSPEYLSVRIAGSDFQKIIRILQKDWETYVPAIPFEYEFLDKHYDGIYKNERQTRFLLTIFSVIAIIISCLGLFGLASFMAERRTKEIGIRKTNGATTSNILRLLSLDFTRWVLLANIIAWPLTWYAMKKWLESFAYRVEIPVWIYLVSGIIAFLIALFTVSFHAVRASRQNPGISLRYE
jgi:putative ABC transport system permease protein